MHHKRRYTNQITLTAYFYGRGITEQEKKTAYRLMEANTDNYDGLLKAVHFYKTPEELEGIVL